MPQENNPPRQDHPSSARLVSALLLAVVALWCIYWLIHSWQYWEDDAYIHLEFARSLAASRGFAFNGRVVAGDTAPLWVFLLAGMHALIPDWIVAGKTLAVLGAIFGLTGAYAFARRLSASLLPTPPEAAIFPAAMVLLIVANPYFCYWIFSGMEPVTAAGISFFAVLAANRTQPSPASFLAGCLLTGIAPLMRPEMIFLAALLTLPLLGQGRRLSSSQPAAAKLASFAAGLLLLITPLTLWSLYSLRAFGHLIPNTNAAKRAAPSDSVVHHLLAIYAPGFPLILCGLLAGIVYLVLRPIAVRDSLRGAIASAFRRTSPPAVSPSLPLAGWLFLLWPAIATVFYIVNHTYVQTRYILVTAPGLTIVILALALKASRRTGRVLYVAALVAAAAISVVTVRPFIRNKGLNCEASHQIALYMRNHLPPNAPVATYGIGQIAFDSDHPIIDTGGITRPGAVPYLNDPVGIVRWAQTEGAQYYIASEQPDPGAVPVYTVSAPFIGWTLNTGRYATSAPVSLWKLAPAPILPAQPTLKTAQR